MKLYDLILLNKSTFLLFDIQTVDELKIYTRRYFKKNKINIKVLNDLLNYKFKKSTFYDILILADYLNYIYIDKLIIEIQIFILKNHISLNYLADDTTYIIQKFLSYGSSNSNLCLLNGKCKCRYTYNLYQYMLEPDYIPTDSDEDNADTDIYPLSKHTLPLYHLSCYIYLTKYKNKYLNTISSENLLYLLIDEDYDTNFIIYVYEENKYDNHLILYKSCYYSCRKNDITLFEYIFNKTYHTLQYINEYLLYNYAINKNATNIIEFLLKNKIVFSYELYLYVCTINNIQIRDLFNKYNNLMTWKTVCPDDYSDDEYIDDVNNKFIEDYTVNNNNHKIDDDYYYEINKYKNY